MTTATERAAALLEGPPAITPQRITEETPLRGRRVVVNEDNGQWTRDQRAIDDPYWYDRDHHLRWRPGEPPPEGADTAGAQLTVAVTSELGYYDWARTKRRPFVVEVAAYLVWAE